MILTLTTPLSDNHNTEIRGNIAAFSFANTFELKDEKMCVRPDPQTEDGEIVASENITGLSGAQCSVNGHIACTEQLGAISFNYFVFDFLRTSDY